MYVLNGLHMDVKYNVALWPLSLLTIKYEMFTNCDLFQYFQNEMIEDLVFKDWIIVLVFLKGCKNEIHKCHWFVVFNHCISSRTHWSIFKLTSTNGASKNKFSFLHEIMLYKCSHDDEPHWNQMLNGQESNLDNDELYKL